MIVFVDDIILASNDDSMLTEVKAMLQERFKMTDLGDLNWFLGIEFKKGADYYALSQSQYFEKLLEKHEMSNCKAASTPCAEKQVFDDDDDDENPGISNETYRSIVESLIYAMTCT
jgi:histone deacetylase 1/2